MQLESKEKENSNVDARAPSVLGPPQLLIKVSAVPCRAKLLLAHVAYRSMAYLSP